MRRASSDCAALPEQVRLWSLHPRYLDQRGLVALWREGLLAQAVIRGETRGYKHHPQLARFRESAAPEWQIAGYLTAVHAEAVNRGYSFDAGKIARMGEVEQMVVTHGQLGNHSRLIDRACSARFPKLSSRQFTQGEADERTGIRHGSCVSGGSGGGARTE